MCRCVVTDQMLTHADRTPEQLTRLIIGVTRVLTGGLSAESASRHSMS